MIKKQSKQIWDKVLEMSHSLNKILIFEQPLKNNYNHDYKLEK